MNGRWARFWALMMLVLGMSISVGAQSVPASGLKHDSRDDLYRTPSGAVPFGTLVTLRLRALEGEIDAASVRTYNTRTQSQAVTEMSKVALLPDGHELWELTIDAGTDPTLIYYRFVVRKGSRVWYYEDDTLVSGEADPSRKGGEGVALESSADASYQIAVYDPSFYTPEWMRNAVIYQIFPDRFRNGDRSNDPAQGSETFYGELDLIYHETWNEPPVDGRRVQTASGLGYFNSDFFGGDLAGITEKLDYLQALGITAIYLNPIFEARSNHRYDTVDYKKIDPILGTMDDFRVLVNEAQARGIVLILDGVFNHMSSDSAIFDRYNRFEGADGACESLESAYRTWFFFRAPTGPEPAVCADDGLGNTFYVSWFGFDSIPKIDNTRFGPRAYFFRGPDSVARLWGSEGIGGWRLDVGGDIDNGRDPKNTYWEGFRKVVRTVNPEAVIIGEEWGDASAWLLGDEWDSVMNYRTRRAVIGLVNGRDFADNDGRIAGLTPAQFEASIRAIEEDYPPMAYRAMMNMLGSHDTVRLLYALGNDTESLKLAASVVFALPGAPTIYYGDEIAIDAPNIDGQDDPYNRAPYPWPDESGDHYPAPNEAVLAHHQALGRLRGQTPALREGEMLTIGSTDEVLALARVDAAAGSAALVLVNVSRQAVEYTLPMGFAAGILPAGLTFEPALGTDQALSAAGGETVRLAPRSAAYWTAQTDPSDFVALQADAAVTTEAQGGQVMVTWSAMDGAAGYHVYRSPVRVGGFERITDAPVADTRYVDDTVSNGYVYYYAVAPVNAQGMSGAQVVSAVPAVPAYVIDSAAFVQDPSAVLALRVGVNVDVEAGVTINGVTGGDLAVRGLRAQAALADTDEPIWSAMSYVGGMNGADIYRVTLKPAAAGDYRVRVRFSADAGQTWVEATLADGTLPSVVVQAGEDVTPPAPAAAVNVVGAGVSGVSLAWDAAVDADAALYRVYRTDQAGQTVLLAELPVDVVTFDDVSVTQGNRYTYAVTVIDENLNESARTASRLVDVTRATFKVRFVVIGPDYTPDDAVVYIAGDFKSGDTYPTWDPAAPAMVMENLGGDRHAVTLELQEGISIDYKFVRGTWDAVEKGRDCEEIANRVLTIGLDSLGAPGADGVYEFEHTVAKWRDLDRCG
jgi:glycosidase